MKQNILLRLFAILCFLLASIAIKSEKCVNSKYNCALKKKTQSATLNEHAAFPLFPSDEGFLIKI